MLLLNRNNKKRVYDNNLYTIYRRNWKEEEDFQTIIYLTRIVYLVGLIVYSVELDEDVKMKNEYDARDSPRGKIE
jgi:hypothetical protein